MVRLVFLLLLLANLVFFVWASGYLGARDEGREPERLKSQLQPDRLRVTVGDDRSSPAPAEVSAAAASVTACRRVGPMSAVDAETLKRVLVAQGAAATSVAADELSYWVFIPATSAGKPADKEIAILKEAGIKDFFVVSEEGSSHNAVSLGLFHKEDAAKELLQRLSKKGIKAAKVTTKARAGGKAMLDVRGESDKLEALLSGQASVAIECPKE
jgi:hypothetical protein